MSSPSSPTTPHEIFTVAVIGALGVACEPSVEENEGILSAKGVGVSLGAPNALRTVVGTGLYLAILGLLALGLGALIRKTAGAISAIVGILFVLPVLSSLLPPSMEAIQKYLPSNAAHAILSGGVGTGDDALSAWLGLGLFFLYAAAVLAVAAYDPRPPRRLSSFGGRHSSS